MKVILPRGNLATTDDTDRMPSRHIWADCPFEDILDGAVGGYAFFDDFLATPDVAAAAEAVYGVYKGFGSTGGSGAEGDEVGGTKVFSSDGDNEGASIATVSKPFQISVSHFKLWFECRLKFSTVDNTKNGVFVGLIDTSTLSATVPIAADGTLADENFVGFHRLEADGDQIDTVYKADGVTQVTVQADALHSALAADTYVKLGFVYDHRPSLYYPGTSKVLTFYANGRRLSTTKTIPSAAGTDFPNDVRLGLVAAILNATGTTPGNMEMDWWKVAQLSAEMP